MSSSTVRLSPESVQRWREFWSSDLTIARGRAIGLSLALLGIADKVRRARGDLAECEQDTQMLRARLEQRAAQQGECAQELREALTNYARVTRTTDICLRLIDRLSTTVQRRLKAHRQDIDSAERRFARIETLRPQLQTSVETPARRF